MIILKYILILLFSIIASFLVINKAKKGTTLRYVSFIFWSIISITLFINNINIKTSLAIIISSLLILFMDSSDTFWDRKFDKKFIKNTALWIGIIWILYIGDVRINFITKPDGTYLYFNNVSSLILTTLWLLIIVNSIKLTSLLPGLTSGFTFIVSLIFFVIAAAQRQNLNMALALSLSLSGVSFSSLNYEFKYSSFHIEKNLNLLYGFFLGIISIIGMLKSPATISIVIPATLLSIPIIDTSYALISTFILGTPKKFILKKIANQFLEKDIPKNKIPILIYFIGLYLSVSSLILYIFPKLWIGGLLLANGILFYNKTSTITKKIEDKKKYEREEKLYILDTYIDKVTLNEAVRKIESFILSGGSHIIVTPDSLAIMRTKKDKEYQKILESADLVTPDGIGILWASKILGNPLKERVTGIDLITKLFELGEKKGFNFYFLGAKEGIAEAAKKNILKKYPKLNIVGVHHGFLDNLLEEKVKKDIKEKKPDILLVGMGVPKQEKWIYKNIHDLNIPVAIGVGGSFDVLSGKIPRAPQWMQKNGIEWVYRVIKEPYRIKRVAKIPVFIVLILWFSISSSLKHLLKGG